MIDPNQFMANTVDLSGVLNNLSGAIDKVAATNKQQDEEDRQKEIMTGLQNVAKSGDMSAVADYLIQNPDISSNVANNAYKAMGIKDSVQKSQLKNDMLTLAANPDNTEQILTDRISTINERGGNPEHTMRELEMYRQDPQGFADQVKRTATVMYPQEMKQLQTSTGETPMTPYQQQLIEAKKTDQELKQLELEQKKLQQQSTNETNELKRKDLEQKIAQNKAKIEQATQAKNKEMDQAITASQTILDSVNDLLNDPNLDSAVGASSLIPTIPGTGKADFETKLESFIGNLTMANMGILKGVLSDSDIKMIRSASSGLSTKMTEKAFRSRLNHIKARLMEKLKKQKSQQQPAQQSQQPTAQQGQQQNDFSSLWGG